MKPKILIIDSEVSIGILLSKFLTKHGFEIVTAISGGTGLKMISDQVFNLVLCDYRLKDSDGKTILIKVKEISPSTGVIIITGYSDIKTAVELIKLGAYDYITKPLYPDEILKTITNALKIQYALITSQNHSPQPESGRFIDSEYINGKSEASIELLKQIQLVAPTPYSVIIIGQSGTGKECVAKTIHLNSLRHDKPFIAMDCGSLTRELAASEFFGHEKGAFTGAVNTKIGHFEQANGGTLFLDEIGNLSYEIQASLLRTVQERKVKRIGSTKEIDLDVRIIVATNEILTENIKKGTFREDLYHRFNEFSIQVPSLKTRGNDILIFADQFLIAANQELKKNISGFSEEVKDCFLNYGWSGNVRELKNVIRRVTLLTNGDKVKINVLPPELLACTRHDQAGQSQCFEKATDFCSSTDLKTAANGAEYEIILNVLKQVNFNKTKAAKILNIDRKTLYTKIQTFQLKTQE